MEVRNLQCRYCGQEFTRDILEQHLKKTHSHLPDFEIICGFNNCEAIFSNLNSLRSHRHRHHAQLRYGNDAPSDNDVDDDSNNSDNSNNSENANNSDVNDDSENSNNSDENDDATYSNDSDDNDGSNNFDNSDAEDGNNEIVEDLPNRGVGDPNVQKTSLGLMLLSMRAQCQVTNDVVLNVIKGLDAVVKRYVLDTLLKTQKVLSEANICDVHDYIDFDDEIASIDTVHGLDTIHKQNAFFSEKFNVIHPVYKDISSHFLQVGEQPSVGNRNVKVSRDRIVYISIKDVLFKNLCDAAFLESLEFNSEIEEGILSSFRDGSKYKVHPIFSLNKKTVEIKLYYDEIELCDAVGTRAGRKQKLGFAYFQVGNRHAKYLGALSSINLVGIIDYPTVKKHTLDPLSELIVEDLKPMENGLELPNGQRICVAVSALSGDNQAIKMICGFKETYSAEHPCQYCLVSLEELQIMTKEDNQRLRTPTTHEEQLREMENAPTEEERKDLGQTYGINRRCPLSKLTGCDPTTIPAPDIGHDFFLGAVPLHTKEFLNRFCVKGKWLTIEEFNQRVSKFDYGYSEKCSKPSPIKLDHLKKNRSIKQTASQMWTLATILPFIVIDRINNENVHYLENYIQLLEIMAIVCSPKISMRSLSYLESLISLYLETFADIYQSDSGEKKKFIPKQHFFLHYPRLIKIFGPLIHFWTMRFEAKHQYFKKIVQAMRNWKNLPLTLARKHQLQQTLDSIIPMENKIECGPKKIFRSSTFSFRFLFPAEDRLCIVKWIKLNGIKFVANRCYVAVGYENRLPVFAEVHKIIWQNDTAAFVCKIVQTEEHNMHLMAYEITTTENFTIHTLESLVFHKVFHCHHSGGKKYIIVKQPWGDLH